MRSKTLSIDKVPFALQHTGFRYVDGLDPPDRSWNWLTLLGSACSKTAGDERPAIRVIP
jgi:hypothetical protein